MALTPIRIPTLTQAQPIVDTERKATNEFLRTINGVLGQIGYALNQIIVLPVIQAALADLAIATQAARDAADAANAAAGDAAAVAASNAREQALVNSYINPSSVLTASPTTITIASHTRMYADGTSVAVNGASAVATGPGDVDYVSYSDPNREGGAVTYIISTTPPVQTGNTHVVGAVEIPATGTAQGGEGPRRPGFVESKSASAPSE